MKRFIALFLLITVFMLPMGMNAFAADKTVLSAGVSEIVTVSFNANKGNVSVSSYKVERGKTLLTALPEPTRDGYTFDGWFTAPEGGKQMYNFEAYYQDITLYAHWTIISEFVTVKFNAGSGSVEPSSFTIETGSSLDNFPTPTRTGYTFDGWFTALSGGERVYPLTKFYKDTTLYAHWTSNTVYVYVNFDANGGSVQPSTFKIEKGHALDSFPTASRNGYIFDGWYSSREGGSRVYSSKFFDKDTTLYAHWHEKPSVSDNPAETDKPTVTPTNPSDTQNKIDISNWYVSGIEDMTYTGKFLEQKNIFVFNNGAFADVIITYGNNKNAGTAAIMIKGTGEFTGSILKTFKISKASNPVTVTAKKKITAKAKKKTTVKKAVTVKNAQGKVTYKTNNKKVKVKNGKITVIKGLKKGKTVKVKITVNVNGNDNYHSKKIVKTIKIKVK